MRQFLKHEDAVITLEEVVIDFSGKCGQVY